MPSDPSGLPSEEEPRVFTVTEITNEIRDLLAVEYASVTVRGEISGHKVSQAGHAYFALKDEGAVLNCAIWKGIRIRMSLALRDGMCILATGHIDVYPPRGSYQLIVESVRPEGEGELQRRFEELKRKLHAEGLFDEERKQPIPIAPERIAVITSPTGAAVRDFLRTLRAGYPALEVDIFPVRVQGAEAPGEIARALDLLGARRLHDLIVVTRGGGSLEDLWGFNEEVVARAIAGCPIPVISAVGHEIDFTIADFVADLRAATPTAAAQVLVQQHDALKNQLGILERRLSHSAQRFVGESRLRIEGIHSALLRASPLKTVELLRQRIDDSFSLLTERVRYDIERRRTAQARGREKFLSLVQRRGAEVRRLLDVVCGRLESLSPETTFGRGFSICSHGRTGDLVTDPNQVSAGDPLAIRVQKGNINAEVVETGKT
jgi:exodeoxyribonuclease VII large subunit